MNTNSLVKSLIDPSVPTFLLGEVPPRDGTPPGQALEICRKFVTRSRALACDGYIVYDIQDEVGRSDEPRPFPFRKLTDPSGYASLVSKSSGKPCVVYKCIADEHLEGWLDECVETHGHRAVNVVGRSTPGASGPTMSEAMRLVGARVSFGCVCIAERHTKEYADRRGFGAPREHENMLRKQGAGAQWFVSQAVYDPAPTISLLKDYAAAAKARGLEPKKVILTFTPVSREKSLRFVKWLGVTVPKETEAAILGCDTPEARVEKSVDLLCDCLDAILRESIDVPLGISVESVSIFKAEINAVHDLFGKLQQRILDARNLPWTVQWRCIQEEGCQRGGPPDDDDDDDGMAPPVVSAADRAMMMMMMMMALGAFIMALGVCVGMAGRFFFFSR
ncbi:hypothetical protein CTAYLR_008335 [Chrysophaeum taylorii]|uniref:Uncharacterized protein n=1 Tax=Chrysophaeum taylorii TaxID=2483200 RepID=A0AAD7UCX5_9STRA|nr:hypothetical protein CTAYLR_008335 [Chrysophaeum taylorii]